MPRRDAPLAAAPQETMATLGEVLLTPTRIYAPAVLAARGAASRRATTCTGSPTSPAAACPGTCRGRCRPSWRARLDPARWPMPSVMRLFGALGGLDDAELRATFNGGLGMALVVARAAAPAAIERARRARRRRRRRRRGVEADALGGARYIGRAAGVGRVSDGRRIAVGVSGRAPTCGRCRRPPSAGELGGEIVLVFADRACPALDWAAEQGIDTALVAGRRATTAARRGARGRASRIWSCWPATCGSSGPAVLRAFRGTDRQHPPVAAAGVPGRPRRPDALAHGVARDGRDGPPRRRRRSTAARSSPRRRWRSCPATTRPRCTARIQAVEHRLLPHAVALLLAGRHGGRPDGRHVTSTCARADASCPRPGARCCRCPTRPGWWTSGAGSSPSASSWSRRAARRGRCATPDCR